MCTKQSVAMATNKAIFSNQGNGKDENGEQKCGVEAI